MLAYDFPLLSLFWAMLEFAALVIIVFVIIWCFIDNFRRKDHRGAAKAAWTIIILLIPILGALMYIIVRPSEASYES